MGKAAPGGTPTLSTKAVVAVHHEVLELAASARLFTEPIASPRQAAQASPLARSISSSLSSGTLQFLAAAASAALGMNVVAKDSWVKTDATSFYVCLAVCRSMLRDGPPVPQRRGRSDSGDSGMAAHDQTEAACEAVSREASELGAVLLTAANVLDARDAMNEPSAAQAASGIVSAALATSVSPRTTKGSSPLTVAHAGDGGLSPPSLALAGSVHPATSPVFAPAKGAPASAMTFRGMASVAPPSSVPPPIFTSLTTSGARLSSPPVPGTDGRSPTASWAQMEGVAAATLEALTGGKGWPTEGLTFHAASHIGTMFNDLLRTRIPLSRFLMWATSHPLPSAFLRRVVASKGSGLHVGSTPSFARKPSVSSRLSSKANMSRDDAARHARRMQMIAGVVKDAMLDVSTVRTLHTRLLACSSDKLTSSKHSFLQYTTLAVLQRCHGVSTEDVPAEDLEAVMKNRAPPSLVNSKTRTTVVSGLYGDAGGDQLALSRDAVPLTPWRHKLRSRLQHRRARGQGGPAVPPTPAAAAAPVGGPAAPPPPGAAPDSRAGTPPPPSSADAPPYHASDLLRAASLARELYGGLDPVGTGWVFIKESFLLLLRPLRGSGQEKLELLFDLHDENGVKPVPLADLVYLALRDPAEPVEAEHKANRGRRGEVADLTLADPFAQDLVEFLDVTGSQTTTRAQFFELVKLEPLLLECFHEAFAPSEYSSGIRFNFDLLKTINEAYANRLAVVSGGRRLSTDMELGLLGFDGDGDDAAAVVDPTAIASSLGDEFLSATTKRGTFRLHDRPPTILDRELDATQFRRLMAEVFGVPADAFPMVNRIFQLFDADVSGAVDLRELFAGLATATRGPVSTRAAFFFALFDLNGNGELDLEEVGRMVETTAASTNVSPAEIRRVFQLFDADGDGSVTLKEFDRVCRMHSQILDVLGRVFGQKGFLGPFGLHHTAPSLPAGTPTAAGHSDSEATSAQSSRGVTPRDPLRGVEPSGTLPRTPRTPGAHAVMFRFDEDGLLSARGGRRFFFGGRSTPDDETSEPSPRAAGGGSSTPKLSSSLAATPRPPAAAPELSVADAGAPNEYGAGPARQRNRVDLTGPFYEVSNGALEAMAVGMRTRTLITETVAQLLVDQEHKTDVATRTALLQGLRAPTRPAGEAHRGATTQGSPLQRKRQPVAPAQPSCRAWKEAWSVIRAARQAAVRQRRQSVGRSTAGAATAATDNQHGEPGVTAAVSTSPAVSSGSAPDDPAGPPPLVMASLPTHSPTPGVASTRSPSPDALMATAPPLRPAGRSLLPPPAMTRTLDPAKLHRAQQHLQTARRRRPRVRNPGYRSRSASPQRPALFSPVATRADDDDDDDDDDGRRDDDNNHNNNARPRSVAQHAEAVDRGSSRGGTGPPRRRADKVGRKPQPARPRRSPVEAVYKGLLPAGGDPQAPADVPLELFVLQGRGSSDAVRREDVEQPGTERAASGTRPQRHLHVRRASDAGPISLVGTSVPSPPASRGGMQPPVFGREAQPSPPSPTLGRGVLRSPVHLAPAPPRRRVDLPRSRRLLRHARPTLTSPTPPTVVLRRNPAVPEPPTDTVTARLAATAAETDRMLRKIASRHHHRLLLTAKQAARMQQQHPAMVS